MKKLVKIYRFNDFDLVEVIEKKKIGFIVEAVAEKDGQDLNMEFKFEVEGDENFVKQFRNSRNRKQLEKIGAKILDLAQTTG